MRPLFLFRFLVLLVSLLIACGSEASESPSSEGPAAAQGTADPQERQGSSAAQDRAFVDGLVGTSRGPFPWEGSASVIGQSREAFRSAHSPSHESDVLDSEDVKTFTVEGHEIQLRVASFVVTWADEQLGPLLNDEFPESREDDPEHQIVGSFDLDVEVDQHTFDALQERLVAQYGEARQGRNGRSRVAIFLDAQHGRRILLWRSGETLITVERYLPLASLFAPGGHFGVGDTNWRAMNKRDLITFANARGWSCGTTQCGLPASETAHQPMILEFGGNEFGGERFRLEMRTGIIESGSSVAYNADRDVAERSMVDAIAEGFGPPNALDDGEADGDWHMRYEFAEDAVLSERRRSSGSIWRLSLPRQAD